MDTALRQKVAVRLSSRKLLHWGIERWRWHGIGKQVTGLLLVVVCLLVSGFIFQCSAWMVNGKVLMDFYEPLLHFRVSAGWQDLMLSVLLNASLNHLGVPPIPVASKPLVEW
jgi:hypothetical protein